MLMLGCFLVAVALAVVVRFRKWTAIIVAIVVASLAITAVVTSRECPPAEDDEQQSDVSQLCFAVAMAMDRAGREALYSASSSAERRSGTAGQLAAAKELFGRSSKICVKEPDACMKILEDAQALYAADLSRESDVEWSFRYVGEVVEDRRACSPLPPRVDRPIENDRKE